MARNDTSRQEIMNVVDQLCGVGIAESVQPSSDLEAEFETDKEYQPTRNEILQRLNISLMEAIDEASEAKKLMQQWKSLLTPNSILSVTQKVATALQIVRKDYAEMTPEMDSLLHILVQLACYIRFLKSQENDDAYGISRTQIKDALFKITRMGRILRQLLPVTDEDIRNYVMQGISDQVLVLDKCVAAIKRAVFCVAVEIILTTLSRVHVSPSRNSVTLH